MKSGGQMFYIKDKMDKNSMEDGGLKRGKTKKEIYSSEKKESA